MKHIQEITSRYVLPTIEADSDRDRWFTADDAKEYGFVDHVVRSAGQVAGSGGTAK